LIVWVAFGGIDKLEGISLISSDILDYAMLKGMYKFDNSPYKD